MSSNPKRAGFRIAVGATLGLVLVATVTLKAAPAFIDTEPIRQTVEEKVGEATGLTFHVDKLKLEATVFQGFQIHLNGNTLTGRDGNPLATVDRIRIQVRYLPILTRRVPEIAQIQLHKINIPVRKTSLFSELKLNLQKPEPIWILEPAELKNTEILLTDYRIEDRQTHPTVRKLLPQVHRFLLTGDKLSIRHLEAFRPIVVSGKIRLFMDDPDTAKPKTKKAPPLAEINLNAEVSQAVLAEAHDSRLEDLKRLALDIKGRALPLSLRYRHDKSKSGIGTIETKRIHLPTAQALTLQIGDTFSLVLPSALGNMYLGGRFSLSDQFRVAFAGLNTPKLTLKGQARLEDIAIYQSEAWPKPLIKGINGYLDLDDEQLRLRDITAILGNLPLRAEGSLNVNQQTLKVSVNAKKLRIASLKKLLADIGAPVEAFKDRELKGLVDFSALVTGRFSAPVYKGLLSLREGSFEDTTLGLSLQDMRGQWTFAGSGLKQARFQYQGRLDIPKGKLTREADHLYITDFSGKIDLDGSLALGQPLVIPSYQGLITVREGHFRHPETGLIIERIHGPLRLSKDRVDLANVSGTLGSTVFLVSGQVTPDFNRPEATRYMLRLNASDIHVPTFSNEVLAKLPALEGVLAQVKPSEGYANLTASIATGLSIEGRLDITRLLLPGAMPEYALKIPTMAVVFNEREVDVQRTLVYYGPVALNLEGWLHPADWRYQFKADSDEIPMSLLRDHTELITLVSGAPTPEIWNTAGSFSLDALIDSESNRINLDFNNVGLSWQGGDFPLYALNGRLFYQQAKNGEPVVSTENLSFRYGNSPVLVDATFNRQLALQSEGVLSALLVNHFLISSKSKSLPYREIPFNASANGLIALSPDMEALQRNDLTANVSLDLDPNLQPGFWGEPTKSLSPASPPKGNTPPLETGMNLGDIALPPARREKAYWRMVFHLQDETLLIPDSTLHLVDAGDLLGNGAIHHVFDAQNRLFEGHFYTQPALDLDKLGAYAEESGFFKGAKGSFAADIQLLWDAQNESEQGYMEGAGLNPNGLTGWLASDRVEIPTLTLRELTGRVDFEGRSARATIEKFSIPGVDARLSAMTEELFELPVTLDNVRIEGELLSVASLVDFNETIVTPIIVNQLVSNFLRPRQLGDPVLPIQFRNGDIHFEEGILQNIILSNFGGKISVFANSFFELTDVRLDAAGGNATGYFSMNPRENNFMTLELNAHGVKANALTRALLNTTNQVFGDLDGTVRFTTFGLTETDMIQNANGTVRMSIADGRLPAIAKVETLLATANILRGGVLGLNLNNLIRSLRIYDTNYFANLSGDLLVANGILYTENLVSDGDNLDLFIQGSVAMDSGDANLLVTGQMNQDVAGKLGALGRLSLRQILGFIPGIVRFGRSDTGLLGYLPGIGYVPGFGGPAGDVSRFQVRLMGDLESPGAIQDFRWLGSQSL